MDKKLSASVKSYETFLLSVKKNVEYGDEIRGQSLPQLTDLSSFWRTNKKIRMIYTHPIEQGTNNHHDIKTQKL